jgi:predicted ATP-dependent endonuclease of OLD family
VAPLIEKISIHGFRAARQVELRPSALCALVGEASSGKSTVLTAIWMLLEAAAPVPTAQDVSHGEDRVLVEGSSGDRTIFLDARPPATLNLNRYGAPPTIFFPAGLRGTSLVAPVTTADAARATVLMSALHGATSIVRALEQLCDAGLTGVVLLIEEPELYLSPQAQRYLYRLLRRFAAQDNQVLYSTHAATFLSVAHLEELALVRHVQGEGTILCQPSALPTDESFRALTEFDAERSEVFLARAALLVEGITEKIAFPFVFEALGYDPDREAIAIIECGGKANMPLFARMCTECGIPFVLVHDRDAPRGQQPNESEQATNKSLVKIAGRPRTVTLVPDFEGVMGLNSRNRKPRKAYTRLRDGRPLPKPLVDAVELVVAAARGETPTSTSMQPAGGRIRGALDAAKAVQHRRRKTPAGSS